MICVQLSYAQENKFSLNLEYSPNVSKLTDAVADERYKLSHNALLRIEFNLENNIKPTIGIGFLNTGVVQIFENDAFPAIESFKFIQNYNYLLVPIGAKIYFGNFYLLPEIGLAINIFNRTKEIIKFTNGETIKETKYAQSNPGEFNSVSIPLSLSIGKEFNFANKTFSTGLKGYYGLNNIIRGLPRNNHYYGLGLIIATKL